VSAGKLRFQGVAESLESLRARVDMVEAAVLQQGQALADCVVRLGKAILELQGQVTMVREAAGVGPDRRGS
jgi:hypothetical protein